MLHRCPACGEGKLFKSYLKQVENCAACGERFGHIRADDAAPWGTIILVGHVFLPLAFLVNVDFLPTWAAMMLWASCFCLLSLAVLPRVQGPVPGHPLAHPRAGLQAGRDRLVRRQLTSFR